MPGIKLPTAAERLRTLLAAASSLTLHVPGHRCDLIGRHHVDETGRVVLELPAGSQAALLLEAERDVAAVIEITDVAPTSVKGRVRSRAVYQGWIQHDGDLRAVLELAEATLADPLLGEVRVEAGEFATAHPDPLAKDEADLLCHLTGAHPEAIEHLSRLIPPHHLHGVRRIVPIRMDRFGVVLRLEFAARHRDVQLPFSAPLRTAEEAAPRMHELLARARCCQRNHSGH